MIYLDNSATTKPYKEVLDTFVTVSEKYFGNPSSLHELGGEAEKLLNQSRSLVANILKVQNDEIYFTSGGTEGNNIAIKGAALQYQSRGKHIITTEIEHPSVYEACKQLENLGFSITYLPVNINGQIVLEDLQKAIRDDTILVSIMHVNNETGSLQPIEKIAALLKDFPKIKFHTDHVQGFGKVPLNINMEGIDLCTISGHKFHGLKGTGILYVKNTTKLFPLFSGGSQENTIRPGTENTAGIVAIAKAMRLTNDKRNELSNLDLLKQELFKGLGQIEGIEINTNEQFSAPHIINFSVLGLKPEVLIHSLEKEKIYVSTKSACSSKSSQASRILLAYGFDEERAKSAIRVSLSFQNTLDDIKVFLEILEQIIIKLREVVR